MAAIKGPGLADEDSDDASSGSGQQGKAIKPSSDLATGCPHKSKVL